MSIEYLELGSSPCDEDCAQVEKPDYPERSRKECQVYKQQIERQNPIPDSLRETVWLGIKTFGGVNQTYREVVVYYDPSVEASIDFAFNLERNTPANWDEEALQLLAEEGQA